MKINNPHEFYLSIEKKNLLTRNPISTPASKGATPPKYSKEIIGDIIYEIDVSVLLRDGTKIYIDIARPLNIEKSAPLIGWGPYGKHVRNNPSRYRPGGMNPEHISPHTRFEAPNPEFWVPHGYAVISVDPRGTWHSEGIATFISEQEALDFYDLIEWAGQQNWSNGKVGLSGVSYLAVSQWRVAALKPPHLAAINPWEGWTDTYREVAYHGGIPDSYFWEFISGRWSSSVNPIEDLIAETYAHPLFDDFWASKTARPQEIDIPAFVVASWSDQGLHTRGTLEGFKQLGSKEKWLLVHGRKKWAHYYEPSNVEKAKTFFDHFLHEKDNDLKSWPKVELELRDAHFKGNQFSASAWPPAETIYKKLFLYAAKCEMLTSPPAEISCASYASTEPLSNIEFKYTFTETTKVAGHMALHTFVQAESAADMDLFIGIKKYDNKGQEVAFPYCAQFDDGPVALGWLRVSHRLLDEEKSTEHQPILAHQRILKLAEKEIVPVSIEIWPSGTIFHPGESISVIIQGTEICKHIALAHYNHLQTVNLGVHNIYTGGDYPSYLVIPTI
jgi:predicted acyl esterase